MGALGVGGEGGRRKNALIGRTTLAGHCIGRPIWVITCCPGLNPGRFLGSTSDSKSIAISTFGQQFRRHLWEDSEMHIFLQIEHIYFAYFLLFFKCFFKCFSHIFLLFVHIYCIYIAKNICTNCEHPTCSKVEF